MILLVEGRALALTAWVKEEHWWQWYHLQHESSHWYIDNKMIFKQRPLSMSSASSPLDTHILNKRKESHKCLAECMIDWSMLLMEIIEWKFIYILLDLTRNSCEKCNLRSLAGIEPVALWFRCSAPTNWGTQASCQALTTSSSIQGQNLRGGI